MGCYPDLYNYLLGHRYHIMRTLAFIAALIGVSLDVSGQPFRLPDPPTPEHAYEQLLAVRCFAFGGVGYAGVTSGGEIAYRAIAGSTNAVALFSATLTNGNVQAKLYGLCGIREFAPGTFESLAEPLRIANPKVETMRGCVVHHEFGTNVISRISSGYYDVYLRSAKH